MKYYILGIFLNYLFFVTGGIFYHILMVDDMDKRVWILFSVGGLFYLPVYLITNISIIGYVKGRSKYFNLYVLPALLMIVLFLILIELDFMDGNIWIVLIIAQILTCLSIHLVKYLNEKWSEQLR